MFLRIYMPFPFTFFKAFVMTLFAFKIVGVFGDFFCRHLYILSTKKSPKYFYIKNIFLQKNLSSQKKSPKNRNQSISVTTHFFRFFYILYGTIGKWTFINVQNGKTFVKPGIVFF